MPETIASLMPDRMNETNATSTTDVTGSNPNGIENPGGGRNDTFSDVLSDSTARVSQDGGDKTVPAVLGQRPAVRQNPSAGGMDLPLSVAATEAGIGASSVLMENVRQSISHQETDDQDSDAPLTAPAGLEGDADSDHPLAGFALLQPLMITDRSVKDSGLSPDHDVGMGRNVSSSARLMLAATGYQSQTVGSQPTEPGNQALYPSSESAPDTAAAYLLSSSTRGGMAVLDPQRPISAVAETAIGDPSQLTMGIPDTSAARSEGSVRTAPSLPVNAPFNQAGWADEVGDRVRWLSNQNIQAADLRINPPQLGPVEVRIHVQHDQMSVMFTSQHAVVREALEAAAPRLREMFLDSGLNLVNVDVSQHSLSQQHQSSHDGAQASPIVHGSEDDPAAAGDERIPGDESARRGEGLVDYYA